MKQLLLAILLIGAVSCHTAKQVVYLPCPESSAWIGDKPPLVFYIGQEYKVNECEINGKRMIYHACGEGDLKEVKESYKNFTYMGSGYIYYVNGVKNISDQLTHFFY